MHVHLIVSVDEYLFMQYAVVVYQQNTSHAEMHLPDLRCNKSCIQTVVAS